MKMKNSILILGAILFMSSSLLAQETIQLDRFDGLIVSGTVNVKLVKGTDLKAEVETDNFDRHDVKVVVDEGILKVNVLKSLIKTDESINVTVTYNDLRYIKGQAGAKIHAKKPIVIDKLELKARQGSDLDFEVQVNALEVVASEGSKVYLAGSAESQEAKAISGGMIYAFNMDAQHAYVTSNTGGQAEVVAKESIEATASTGGKIEYKGKPAKTKTKDYLKGKIIEL